MTANTLPAPEYVRTIAPYQAGKPIEELAREFGLDPDKIVKLASNENPLGMSPAARQAAIDAIASSARYPDSNGFYLKQVLADRYQLSLEHLLLGNGSNDILEIVADAFLSPATSSVYAQYAFTVYRLATQAAGARHIMVPARDYGHDLDAMLTAIAPDTSVVFIANPNNPTGTFVPGDEVERFVAAVHAAHGTQVIVVLDEAYNEYLAPELRFDSAALVRKYPNLLVSRTLSKAYGLAGLRVGFAMAHPDIIGMLNRVRQPFNVSVPAQAAAIASLNDAEFLQRSFEVNRDGLAQLTRGVQALGLEFVPSYGNFILVRVGDAAGINLELLKRGVIVRPVAGDGLPEWLRISVGVHAENERFLTALRDILQKQ